MLSPTSIDQLEAIKNASNKDKRTLLPKLLRVLSTFYVLVWPKILVYGTLLITCCTLIVIGWPTWLMAIGVVPLFWLGSPQYLVALSLVTSIAALIQGHWPWTVALAILLCGSFLLRFLMGALLLRILASADQT